MEFQRLFPKVRIYIVGAVDLCGKSKHSSQESSKNRLVTRSHVISQEEETRSSPEVEKAVIWYKVIIEIAQEVETSFQEVGKEYLLGRR